MSLDYSSEQRRQHSQWVEIRRRLNGPKFKLVPKPIPAPMPALPKPDPVVSCESLWKDWLLQMHLAPPAEDEPQRSFRIADIAKEVCRQFNISMNDMTSHRKTTPIVRPRQAAMALSHRLTKRSYPEIGRYFSKDHTTVMHAKQQFQPIMDAVDARVTDGSPLAVWVAEFKAEMAVTPPLVSKYRKAKQ